MSVVELENICTVANSCSYGLVVVHYRGLPDLESCLASALENLGQFEVVVVQTGTEPEVAEIVRRFGAAHIWLPSNPGYGAALNVGLSSTGGVATICSNSDVTFPPGTLDRLADLAATVSGIVFPFQSSTASASAHSDSLLDQLSFADTVRRWTGFGRRSRTKRRKRLIDSVVDAGANYGFSGYRYSGSGACFALSASALAVVGKIPDEFFLQEEDRLLCLRAAESAVPLLLAGGIGVVHVGGMRSVRVTPADAYARAVAELTAYRIRRGVVPVRARAVVFFGLAVRRMIYPVRQVISSLKL